MHGAYGGGAEAYSGISCGRADPDFWKSFPLIATCFTQFWQSLGGEESPHRPPKCVPKARGGGI